MSERGPFLNEVQGQVRTIVVTSVAAQRQAMEPQTCTLQAFLFDTQAPRSLDVLASEGECKLYSGSSNLAFEMQRWICAGAINVTYGGRTERLSLCPDLAPYRPGAEQVTVDCTGLTAGATVQVSSGNEIDTDTVTDLDASVTLPDPVNITQPTSLGVVTWPEAGPLEVRWTSAGATSAVVLLQVRNPTGPSPIVVCLPSTNGQVTIPGALIQHGNFRTQDAMLRVMSYRDTRTMAEGGSVAYRISAGFGSAVLLQARR